MKVLYMLKDILLIVSVLLYDLVSFLIKSVKKIAPVDVLSKIYNFRPIHSFVWYFANVFMHFQFSYNHSASYEPEDVKSVKLFIKELEKSIEDNTFVLDEFNLKPSNNDKFWISNRWYSNDLKINGTNITPRKSELHTLIGLYKNAKKAKSKV